MQAVETRDWPFVGREPELERIVQGIRSTGAVISGAAGVGKTRLATMAVATLDPRTHLVHRAFGTPAATGIPLGAFASSLPARPAGSRPVEHAADALRTEAGGRHLVLVVDDANLLDETSANLVEHLVELPGISALLTIRSGEPAGFVGDLVARDGMVRVDLDGLSEDDVRRLVEGAFRGRLDHHTLQMIWENSGGNPLLVREIVLSGLDSGDLRPDVEGWRWRGPLAVGRRLSGLIESQLDRLTPRERELLELLAFGEPLDATVAAGLAEPGVLAGLDARGLVRTGADNDGKNLRLGHPMYGEVLRARCPSLRARRHQRTLAERLTEAGTGRSDVLRIAVWLLDSGSPAPVDTLVAAAQEAWLALDIRLAERLAREAVDAGGGLPAIEILAAALSFGPRPERADRLLSDLAATATPEDRQQLSYLRAVNLILSLGRAEDAAGLITELLETTRDPQLRRRLEAMEVHRLYFTGQVEAATRVAQRLLAEPDVDVAVRSHLVLVRAQGLAYSGKHAAAYPFLREQEAILSEAAAAPPWILPAVRVLRADVAFFALDVDDLDAVADSTLHVGHRWDFPTAFFYGCKARAARLRGRPAEALRWARDGAILAGRGVPLMFHDRCATEIAHAHAILGQAAEAEAALRAGARRASGGPLARLWSAEVRPWIAAAKGDLASARQLAEQTVLDARALSATGFEARALHDLVRLGAARSAVDRLSDLAEELDGPAPQLYAAHARAVVSADPAALERVAAEFEGLGLRLYAAEAISDAVEAYAKAGLAQARRGAQRRVDELAEQLEGARTPALARGELPDLTGREREVARLASAGLDNPQIAERLAVSRRTVENHLHRVYTKLGILNRTELGAWFDPS